MKSRTTKVANRHAQCCKCFALVASSRPHFGWLSLAALPSSSKLTSVRYFYRAIIQRSNIKELRMTGRTFCLWIRDRFMFTVWKSTSSTSTIIISFPITPVLVPTPLPLHYFNSFIFNIVPVAWFSSINFCLPGLHTVCFCSRLLFEPILTIVLFKNRKTYVRFRGNGTIYVNGFLVWIEQEKCHLFLPVEF